MPIAPWLFFVVYFGPNRTHTNIHVQVNKNILYEKFSGDKPYIGFEGNGGVSKR